MASVDIWKNAPSTIRQHSQQEFSQKQTATSKTQPYTESRTQQITPPRPNDNHHLPRTPQSDNLSTSRSIQPNLRHAARLIDDNTITTAFSNTTTINSSNAAKIAELEQAIKNNQNDFHQMNARFDKMETQIINTMTSCHDNSKHILSMQSQLNFMQNHVQEMVNQMKLLNTHLTTTPTPPSDRNQVFLEAVNTSQSPEKKKQRQTMEPEEITTTSKHRPFNLETIYPVDPDSYTQITSDQNKYRFADQQEDQYTDHHFPGTADET